MLKIQFSKSLSLPVIGIFVVLSAGANAGTKTQAIVKAIIVA